MTNREKYIDEILALMGWWGIKDGKMVICSHVSCEGCLFNEKEVSCSSVKKQWLKEEYTEPEVDWSKVEIDTPILVRRSDDGDWKKRYFAKVENGKVIAWNYGRTSWNNNGCSAWEQAKLAEKTNCLNTVSG